MISNRPEFILPQAGLPASGPKELHFCGKTPPLHTSSCQTEGCCRPRRGRPPLRGAGWAGNRRLPSTPPRGGRARLSRALSAVPSLWGIGFLSLVHVRQNLPDTSMDFKHQWVWKDRRFFYSSFLAFASPMPGLTWIPFLPAPFPLPLPLSAPHHLLAALGWMDFCNSSCCILWTCYYYFSVRHICWMREGRRLPCSWSLPLQASTFKFPPKIGRCQFPTSATAAQNQRSWTFKLWLSELDCWPLLGLSGVSKEYWVLQIGTEDINLLNPLNL